MKSRLVVAGVVGCLLVAGAVCPQASRVEDNLPQPPAGKAWKLVWNDEFDGATLDEAKWATPPDAPRHQGWWLRKAVTLDGSGHLVIQTSREGDKIVGGCVRTKGKFAHAFGYYVARVKLPHEQGHWSAFWLFEGVHTTADGWYNGSEIDIYEKFWPNDEVKHTLYWDPAGDHKLKEWSQIATVPGIRQGWHTFALWWKPDAYVYYVDGKESWRINPGGICQVPMYLKLSDEHAAWCKDISKAKLPDEFVVDYVRVYDLVDKP